MRIMMSGAGAAPTPVAPAAKAVSAAPMDVETPAVPIAASARTSQKRKIEDVDSEPLDNSPEAILSRAMANTFEVY